MNEVIVKQWGNGFVISRPDLPVPNSPIWAVGGDGDVRRELNNALNYEPPAPETPPDERQPLLF